MDLKEKIKNKSAKLGVIGLGYVGLPTAVEFAKAGFSVLGFEKSKEVIKGVNSAKSHIKDVKEDDVWLVTQRNRLKATADLSKLKEIDVILICVPTPLDNNKQPDVKYITGAVKSVIPNAKTLMTSGLIGVGLTVALGPFLSAIALPLVLGGLALRRGALLLYDVFTHVLMLAE